MKKLTVIPTIFMITLTLSLLFFYKSGRLQGIFNKKSEQNQTCFRCNILLIDLDVLRADELPCYGYFRNTAPNICRFAEKSVQFMDNYSTSNWTLPDMFSTITSLYPAFHKVNMSFFDKLSDKIPTLAETLQKEGYQTVLVNGNPAPQTLNQSNGGYRGYDKIIDTYDQPIEKVVSELSNSNKPWFIHYYRGDDLHLPYLLDEGMVPIDAKMIAPNNFPIYRNDFNVLLNKYLKKHYSEIFLQKATDELDPNILKTDLPQDTRLADYFNKLGSNLNLQEYIKDSFIPIFSTYLESFDQKNSSEIAYVRMMYDTLISNLDKNHKNLIQILEGEILSKNTITVLMSDHGEEFYEHGQFSHFASHHSELYYTPLIIHSPQLSAKQVKQPTSNMDVFPTLLELAGIKKIDGLQGQSLVPIINDELLASDRLIFSDTTEGEVLQNKHWLYYLPNDANSIEQSILYNKESDPAENTNVVKSYPDFVFQLFKQLSLLRSYKNINYFREKTSFDSGKFKLDPEKLKRLQREGYF